MIADHGRSVACRNRLQLAAPQESRPIRCQRVLARYRPSDCSGAAMWVRIDPMVRSASPYFRKLAECGTALPAPRDTAAAATFRAAGGPTLWGGPILHYDGTHRSGLVTVCTCVLNDFATSCAASASSSSSCRQEASHQRHGYLPSTPLWRSRNVGRCLSVR